MPRSMTARSTWTDFARAYLERYPAADVEDLRRAMAAATTSRAARLDYATKEWHLTHPGGENYRPAGEEDPAGSAVPDARVRGQSAARLAAVDWAQIPPPRHEDDGDPLAGIKALIEATGEIPTSYAYRKARDAAVAIPPAHRSPLDQILVASFSGQYLCSQMSWPAVIRAATGATIASPVAERQRMEDAQTARIRRQREIGARPAPELTRREARPVQPQEARALSDKYGITVRPEPDRLAGILPVARITYDPFYDWHRQEMITAERIELR